MKMVVRLARATNTSIDTYLKMPLKRLYEWSNTVSEVIKEDGG